ncbi:MAG: large subunit ribosomal protein L13 [Microgenomates group bacterium Gr01-1014_93]|nr:MAG: large subunit ribosomal protein L13 [Microgenomates group bacterium Gr01-1014_93]
MSTNVISAKDIIRQKHTLDASGKILGRLSVEVARLLMGKHKPNFVPYLDSGDFVVITNADKIKVTGKKLTDKKYAKFSGYPGSLRFESMDIRMQKYPEKVLEHSVKGMLPKGKLGRAMFKKLKVYKGEI